MGYFDFDNFEECVKYEIFMLLLSGDYIKLEDLVDMIFVSCVIILNDMK